MSLSKSDDYCSVHNQTGALLNERETRFVKRASIETTCSPINCFNGSIYNICLWNGWRLHNALKSNVFI